MRQVEKRSCLLFAVCRKRNAYPLYCERTANVVNVEFDHHCDLCLVKVIINSRHLPHVLTT